MTDLPRPALLLAAASAVLVSGAAAKPADWKTLANCAAAYQVNAQVADPSRAASMSAMVDETAQDYLAAARKRHQVQTKSSEAQAKAAVASQSDRRRQALAGRSRRTVERQIEACPQPDE